MNFDKKSFLGKLNSDIDERLFSAGNFRGDYSDAYNILVLSAIDSGIGLVKGFKGTTEVSIPYDYSSTSRKIIGRHADIQTRKIYFFIAHSTLPSSNDGIYELDVFSKTVIEVIKGSFLKLNNTMRITGIDVIDGKYLLYTDGENTPRNIDIDRAKAGELTTEMQISAIKPAPTRAPYSLISFTDSSYADNNIRGNFFQFKYRWVYKDNTKSTFSPISRVSDMGSLFLPELDQTESYQSNNAIKFKYNIPNNDVKLVEIAARVGNTGDFGIIESLTTDPNKVNKSILLSLTGVNTGTGIFISVGVGGDTPVGASFTNSSISSLTSAIYNFFVSQGFEELLDIIHDPSLGYVKFTSKQKGVDFEVDSSDENLANVNVLVNIPFVGDNQYVFKNNNILTVLSVRDSNLQYDRIPIKALAQRAVNGSNVVYGGVTEGYDVGDVNISADVIVQQAGSRSVSSLNTPCELAFFSVGTSIYVIEFDFNLNFNDGTSTSITIDAGTYTGPQLITSAFNKFKAANPNIRIYQLNAYSFIILSNFGNDISASSGSGVFFVEERANGTNIAYTSSGYLLPNSILSVKVAKGNAIVYFTYTTTLDEALSSCVANLCEIINRENNLSLVAYPVPAAPLELKIYSTDGQNIEADGYLEVSPAICLPSLKGGDSYSIGVVYSDQYGRTSSVITNQDCSIEVPFYRNNSPSIYKPVVFISSRPPVWAKYWSIVMTKRKRVNSFLQFGITTIGGDGDIVRFFISGAYSNIPFYNNTFGAKISYTFTEGDRARFIRLKNGTPFSVLEDLPILGVSEDGALEIPALKNIAPDYNALEGCVVEVYSPNNYSDSSAGEVLFYETGLSGYVENFGLPNRFHQAYEQDLESGEVDPQTSDLAYPLKCRPNVGDVWVKLSRLINFTKNPDGFPNEWSVGDFTYFQSMYQSDRYPIKAYSVGRPNAFDENYRQVFRKATMYFSESYFIDSSENNINRVYEDSFKDYDQTYGAIKLLYLDGFSLYNFQENKVGVIPVLRQMVFNQDGSSNLILSSQLLNDCRYFDYVGGINNNPESFCFNQFNKYFVDIENNAVCKIGGNGIIRISDIGMVSHFTEVFTKYKKTNPALASGQTPRFYGAWDEDNKLVIFAPETIIENPEDPILTTADTIAYSETQNGWSTKIDFKPSAIIGAFGELFSWSPNTGKLWTHNTNDVRNLFYGVQRTRSIEVPSCLDPNASQSFLSLIQEPAMLPDDRFDSVEPGSAADPSIWNVPVITTALGQESNLLAEDFEKKEGLYFAGFYRDTTTPVTNPLLEGDALKGVWIKLKLTNSSPKDIGLNSILIGCVLSKRTGA